MQPSFRIGILGFGPYGQFVARRMVSVGLVVGATSRSDHSAAATETGVAWFATPDELIDWCDCLFVVTSILSFESVIRELPLEKLSDKLVIDGLSVKVLPRDVLLRELPESADILCVHGMFGPESGRGSWAELPFVFDRLRIRDMARADTLLAFFENQGCRMLEMSCEEHDRLAARSQFVAHAIGRLLDEVGIEPVLIPTRGYQALLNLREQTCHDSTDLFIGLYRANPFAPEMLARLRTGFERVVQLLESKNT